MEAYRLRALIRIASPFSRQKIVSFCSNAAANPRRPSQVFSDDSESGSSVYRHALKFKRPTSVKWRNHLWNSVSFIGSVEYPPKVCNMEDGVFAVHTLLRVKSSRDSQKSFWILLLMRDWLAEISMRHLKPNDYIFVSGRMGCYTKAVMNEELMTKHNVNVEELNYVAQQSQGHTTPILEKTDTGGDASSKSCLHMWQLFFANPYEWWDNRKCKSYPRQPDFKHKDAKESIQISQNDPPWVKRQLQLHDSRMAKQGHNIHNNSHSRLSTWVFDDHE